MNQVNTYIHHTPNIDFITMLFFFTYIIGIVFALIVKAFSTTTFFLSNFKLWTNRVLTYFKLDYYLLPTFKDTNNNCLDYLEDLSGHKYLRMADYKNNISSDEDEGRYEDTEVILDRYYQHIRREGKHKECLSLCSKAIEIADDTRNPRLVKANIRMFMASIFKDLKKYELAILQVEEVLTTVKKREWSQLLLEYQEEYAEDEHWQGCSFRDREKYFEALQFFDHSIKICPNIQQFYISRAICHLKMKNYKQCIYDCEEGHRCPGYSNPKCYLVQGIAFASLNKFVQARACYKKVIQLDPFNETARHEFENTLKKTCLYADSDGPANTQFQLKPFY